jgi:hypothetical protein
MTLSVQRFRVQRFRFKGSEVQRFKGSEVQTIVMRKFQVPKATLNPERGTFEPETTKPSSAGLITVLVFRSMVAYIRPLSTPGPRSR